MAGVEVVAVEPRGASRRRVRHGHSGVEVVVQDKNSVQGFVGSKPPESPAGDLDRKSVV